MELTTIKGNALEPVVPQIYAKNPKIIMHIVNDKGGWGAGFTGALSKKWPDTEFTYREWFKTRDFALGKMMACPVGDNTWVCHMAAQHGFRQGGNPPGHRYVNYVDLANCLVKVFKFAEHIQATVHAPKIGSGLAGGDWETIKGSIEHYSGETPVTIYEL